jgi:ribosomal protein S18 acetylase RimI-like enzyme
MSYAVPLDHSIEAVAQAIHTVQMAAYTQEASLLGVKNFPPLHRTVAEIVQSGESYFGVYESENLVGALGLGLGQRGHGKNINSLVVLPNHQRRGIASALLAKVVAQHGTEVLTVQTGAKNLPALALYSRFGFREIKRWLLDQELLELVQLYRAVTRAPGAA